MRWFLVIWIFLFFSISLHAQIPYFQDTTFSRQDSLRGSLNRWRTCYDVTYYHLRLKIDPGDSTIWGANEIWFEVQEPSNRIQVDLFANMNVEKILFEKEALSYSRDSNAMFVDFPDTLVPGDHEKLTVYYGGKPKVAKKPPWDGGFVWKYDRKGDPWVGVACEGTGASLWWPNKDHLSDEPDSMRMTYLVPSDLLCVANGTLEEDQPLDNGFTRYTWKISYPVNNYNVTFNLANYAYFREYYRTRGDSLPLDYYVLSYNPEKAKQHFQQVKGMLRCYEKYFGPYPFWEDGYKLVETSYWGMEHQSAVAYGNQFQNNAFGFDFIIIHESAHEWWGNSVSVRDHGAMWIHEAFATYAEALYLECRQGYERSVEYLLHQRKRIQNFHPILGPGGVNYRHWPDADMYYKGSWMLHSLRNMIDNDPLWFKTLKALTAKYRYKTVNTQMVIDFLEKNLDRELWPFFKQFLYFPNPPVLKYRMIEKEEDLVFRYRWKTDTEGFNMPVTVMFKDKKIRLHPAGFWKDKQFSGIKPEDLQLGRRDFYFRAEKTVP